MMPASREREAARSRAAQPNPRWSRRPVEAAAQRPVRRDKSRSRPSSSRPWVTRSCGVYRKLGTRVKVRSRETAVEWQVNMLADHVLSERAANEHLREIEEAVAVPAELDATVLLNIQPVGSLGQQHRGQLQGVSPADIERDGVRWHEAPSLFRSDMRVAHFLTPLESLNVAVESPVSLNTNVNYRAVAEVDCYALSSASRVRFDLAT